MLQRLVMSALLAGAVAGLLAAVLQLVFLQPVLLAAEAYESGAAVHFGNAPVAPPESRSIDLVRDGLSVVFSVAIYVGYAILLLALMVAATDRGHVLSPRLGLVWGVAGFVAMQLAPAYGLPPELPGMAAADLVPRQIWWYATAAATGLALWLIAFGQSPIVWAGAVILLALPHLVGAPAPETMTGPAPPELAAEFAARALGTGLAAWAVTGLLAALFWLSSERR